MQSIERTVAILRLIARSHNRMGVSDIAQELALPKSTVSRFLVALEAEGMVARSPENHFSLGEGMKELTRPRSFHELLAEIARPALQLVHQRTGEAVGLSVLEGFQITYIDHISSRQAVQVVDWTGQSLPLHVTSSGKLLLAFSPRQKIEEYLRQPLLPFSTHSIVSAAMLEEQLQLIQTRRYAVSDEEFAEDVLGYAAPVRGEGEEIVAAITLYGPKFRLTELGTRDELIGLLRAGSQIVERRLSFSEG